MKNIKRKMSFALCIAFMLIFNTACNNKEPIKAEDKPLIKGNILIWSNLQDSNTVKDLANNFTLKNPNVKIQVETLDDISILGQFDSKSNGNEKLPDIVVIKDDEAAGFLNQHKEKLMDVVSAAGLKKDEYLKCKIDNLSNGGKTYGVPWYIEPVVMVYRNDILNQIGSNAEDIKTWNDYIQTGTKLLQTSGKKMLVGMNDNNSTLYSDLIKQLGINYLNDSGDIDVNSKNSINTVMLLKNLSDQKIQSVVSSQEDAINAFKSGEAASIICTPAILNAIKNKAPELKDKLSIGKLPAFEPGGNRNVARYGSSFMLTRSADNSNAAIEFVKYAIQDKDNQIKHYTQNGLLVADISAYAGDKMYTSDSYFNNEKLGLIYIDIARNMPCIKYNEYYIDIRNMVIKTTADAISQNKDLVKTMEEIQKQVNENPI
ncbi:MAG: extracellular solute-binding protein [Bacillota bacterium]|nr:extracellular solute-binding protein [Bacillota bacterium]